MNMNTFQMGQAKENISYLTKLYTVPSIEHVLPRTLTINQGRYALAFLASRTTHRRAITLENDSRYVLPYCVVFSNDD